MLEKTISRLGCKIEIAKILINHGANVHKVDETGESLLHKSCFSGAVEMALFLIDYSIDTNKFDDAENLPLHYAGDITNEKLLMKLTDPPVDVNFKQIHGQTPLELACHYKNIILIKILLEKGANPRLIKPDTLKKLSPELKEFINQHAQVDKAKLIETARQIAGRAILNIPNNNLPSKEKIEKLKVLVVDILSSSILMKTLVDSSNHEIVLMRNNLSEYLGKEIIKLLQNPYVFDAKNDNLDEAEIKTILNDALIVWDANNKKSLEDQEKAEAAAQKAQERAEKEARNAEAAAYKAKSDAKEIELKRIEAEKEKWKALNNPAPAYNAVTSVYSTPAAQQTMFHKPAAAQHQSHHQHQPDYNKQINKAMHRAMDQFNDNIQAGINADMAALNNLYNQ